MKKIIITLTLLSTTAFADLYRAPASQANYVQGIQPSLGLSRGQIVVQGDYEYRFSDAVGFGGMFSYTPQDYKNDKYYGLLAFGATARAHVTYEQFDFYIKPGMGIAWANDGTTSRAFLAPLLGIGALFNVNDHIAVGAEQMQIFNWTEKDVRTAKFESFLVSAQFKF